MTKTLLIYYSFEDHTIPKNKCNLFRSLTEFWKKMDRLEYHKVVIESIVER